MADDIKKKERAIGRKAAKMTQQHVHNILRQKLQIRGQGDDKIKPIMKATKVRSIMGDYRLQGLNLNSSKIGFILHYGFVGIKDATTVFNQASKGAHKRKAHSVNMPERLLFEDIYAESGAIDYLVNELSKTRTDIIKVDMQRLVLQINKQNKDA